MPLRTYLRLTGILEKYTPGIGEQLLIGYEKVAKKVINYHRDTQYKYKSYKFMRSLGGRIMLMKMQIWVGLFLQTHP